MRKFCKSLLLVALFIITAVPVWGQASTQGKEFWVSSSLVCSPDKSTATPFIAISAEKACTVNITGGEGNAINITRNVEAGSWNEFRDNNGLEAAKWYPTAMNNANSVSSLAGQKNMYGLHITATQEISVYVILSSKNSMDASNILPVTAIGKEYYTQDYWSKVKSDFNDAVGLTTILGTEDNTKVEITPKGTTFDGKSSTFTIDLNKGQTYYLVTQKGERLAGTHIVADKPVAVYCGVPLTNIPSGVAARDCLFEQSMPIEYWGTQFIVTRSLKKNGNLIGITASTDGTEVKVDGYTADYIDAGDTYYIMLQSSFDPNSKTPGEQPIGKVLTQDAVFIETSCPSAVYSYDTGNSYKGQDGTEIDGSKGDPSSVWISPIQQKIGKITFGTCYTEKTKDHFLNVVAETATCSSTKLTAIYGANQLDKSSSLVWQVVPGNPKFSYARAQIGDNSTKDFSVFRLESKRGFIATVYGNGDDESYAYSAGSSAVQYGVEVNGVNFADGDVGVNNEKFCIGEDLVFDFSNTSPARTITQVDIDFGDGVSETYYDVNSNVTHQYQNPTWYDIQVKLYFSNQEQKCDVISEELEKEINFAFVVTRPDTIRRMVNRDCITWDYKLNGVQLTEAEAQDLLKNGRNDTAQGPNCFDTVYINLRQYGIETFADGLSDTKKDTLGYQLGDEDAVYVKEFGKWYSTSFDTTVVSDNAYKCNHYHPYYVHIISCVNMNAEEDELKIQACKGEMLQLEYTKRRGDVSDVHFVLYKITNSDPAENDTLPQPAIQPVMDTLFTWSDWQSWQYVDEDSHGVGYILLPTTNLQPGKYRMTMTLGEGNIAECGSNPPFIVERYLYVNYPRSIVVQKMLNNVFAVLGSAYNGGYEFTAFQWYRNGEPIEGATGAVYHSDIPFDPNDVYTVALTDSNGITIPSCEIIPKAQPKTDPEPAEDDTAANAPAQKLLYKSQMVIRKDGQMFNIFGQKVR